jgi:DNA-binding GntR family transcriptional regulator
MILVQDSDPIADEDGRPAFKRPARLGEEVYNTLYAQLMSQRIPPGGRVSVDSLVRELGVSQTPIREALSRLEAQGLVVKTHLVGYSAARQLDREGLEDLYEVRLLLEPYAARAAARRATPEQLADLEKLAREMGDNGGNSPRAYGQFARLDGSFHDLIAEAGGNTLIRDTLARLHTHVHLFRLYHHAQAASDANTEHDALLAALKARDEDAAQAAMTTHIERSRQRFLVAFT